MLTVLGQNAMTKQPVNHVKCMITVFRMLQVLPPDLQKLKVVSVSHSFRKQNYDKHLERKACLNWILQYCSHLIHKMSSFQILYSMNTPGV